jgi:hypothetical protein
MSALYARPLTLIALPAQKITVTNAWDKWIFSSMMTISVSLA